MHVVMGFWRAQEKPTFTTNKCIAYEHIVSPADNDKELIHIRQCYAEQGVDKEKHK